MSNDAHLQLVNGPSSTEQVSFNENHSDFPLDVNILRQLQQLHLQTSNLNQPSQHASQAQLSQFHSRYSGMSGSGSGLGGSPGFAPVSEGAADFTSTATTDPMLHEFWSEQARRDQASVTPSRSAPNLSALVRGGGGVTSMLTFYGAVWHPHCLAPSLFGTLLWRRRLPLTATRTVRCSTTLAPRRAALSVRIPARFQTATLPPHNNRTHPIPCRIRHSVCLRSPVASPLRQATCTP